MAPRGVAPTVFAFTVCNLQFGNHFSLLFQRTNGLYLPYFRARLMVVVHCMPSGKWVLLHKIVTPNYPQNNPKSLFQLESEPRIGLTYAIQA